MSIFKPQHLYCPACGTKFLSSFNMKLCCSMECLQELEWRRILYVLGEDYKVDPGRLEFLPKELIEDI
jgi:hypothetical protein